MCDRRIAQARIGTTLIGRFECDRERPAGLALHRQLDDDFLAVNFDIAKGVILLQSSGGNDRSAEFRALQVELEFLVIQVIAVGDLPPGFQSLAIHCLGGKPERLIRIEKIVGPGRQRSQTKQSEGKLQQHFHGTGFSKDAFLLVSVSRIIQCR